MRLIFQPGEEVVSPESYQEVVSYECKILNLFSILLFISPTADNNNMLPK
jgi:hypothetical protein